MIDYFMSLSLEQFMFKWVAIFLIVWITGFIEIQLLHGIKISFSLMYVLIIAFVVKVLLI